VPLPLASFTNVRKQWGATIKLNKVTVEVVGTEVHSGDLSAQSAEKNFSSSFFSCLDWFS